MNQRPDFSFNRVIDQLAVSLELVSDELNPQWPNSPFVEQDVHTIDGMSIKDTEAMIDVRKNTFFLFRWILDWFQPLNRYKSLLAHHYIQEEVKTLHEKVRRPIARSVSPDVAFVFGDLLKVASACNRLAQYRPTLFSVGIVEKRPTQYSQMYQRYKVGTLEEEINAEAGMMKPTLAWKDLLTSINKLESHLSFENFIESASENPNFANDHRAFVQKHLSGWHEAARSIANCVRTDADTYSLMNTTINLVYAWVLQRSDMAISHIESGQRFNFQDVNTVSQAQATRNNTTQSSSRRISQLLSKKYSELDLEADAELKSIRDRIDTSNTLLNSGDLMYLQGLFQLKLPKAMRSSPDADQCIDEANNAINVMHGHSAMS